MTQELTTTASNLQVITTTTSNRVAPWIGLGPSGEWDSYLEALQACGLDFTVQAKPAFVEEDTGNGMFFQKEVPGISVNMREDNQDILGAVSTGYGIVQNDAAFSMLQPFLDAGGIITNGGMTQEGLCFMVLRLKHTQILGDTYDVDVMCTNSFNGKFPCALIMVPTRIICQNMYRGLMRTNKDKIISFRHGSLAPERMAAMTAATSSVMTYLAGFQASLESAYANSMTDKQIIGLIEKLFPYPKPGGPREVTSKERIDEMRCQFYDKYYKADDNANFLGTGMGFINAYYDYLSHREPTRNVSGNWASRRLSGLMAGNVIKTNLIQEAVR